MATASSATRPSPPTPKRLEPDDVSFLVLEGGGGKGFAYLGALGVLEELHVMEHIKGFAGSSAGAITALLLSMGYTRKELEEFLVTTKFDTFFDAPTQRVVPVVGGCEPVFDNEEERALIASLEDLSAEVDLLQVLVSVLAGGISGVLGGGIIAELLAVYLWNKRAEVEQLLKKKASDPPFSVLLAHWPKYVAYMGRDMGLFAGCEARRLFDRLIRERLPRGSRTGFRDMTFAEHRDHFGKALLMTGSNLTTGRTQLFSAKETPDFHVADAVRISMSLPFFYKPYVIREAKPGWPPCGTYVDGGLWNNLPFREFDTASPAATPSKSSAAKVSRANKPSTLGVRLEITPSVSVRSFGDLLARIGNFGLFGTGETQVLSKYIDQMILLDTRGLDLINFNPPKPDRDRAVKRARRETWRYFGYAVPTEDLDPEDDDETKRVLAADRPCS